MNNFLVIVAITQTLVILGFFLYMIFQIIFKKDKFKAIEYGTQLKQGDKK